MQHVKLNVAHSKIQQDILILRDTWRLSSS